MRNYAIFSPFCREDMAPNPLFTKEYPSSITMSEKIVLTEENTKVVQKPVIYNGQTQEIPIWILLGEDTVLSEGIDYELDSEFEGKWAAEYSVTVRGIGEYTGAFTAKGVILLPESPLITESVYRAYLLRGQPSRAPAKYIDYDDSGYVNLELLSLPHPSYEDLVEEYERKHAPPEYPTVTVSVFSHQSELCPKLNAVSPEASCRVELKDEAFRAVLASGAAYSYQPQLYAAALVKKFAQYGADIFYEPNDLYQASMDWCDAVLSECVDDPKKWEEELSILSRKRASATIAGLEFFRDSRMVKIDAVGNSVVFILTLKDDWEISAYTPSLTHADFRNTPYMIHSDENIMVPDEEVHSYFSLHASDCTCSEDKAFLLTSAPLAKFILTPDSHYAQQEKLNNLIMISSPEEFSAFCVEQQRAGRLDNGDITMMVVSVE